MPRLRLRTKLVLAITAMVVVLVVAFAYLYISQLVRARVTEAYIDGDFVTHQIFNDAREVMDGIDFDHIRVDTSNPAEVRTAIRAAMEADAGLNNLLQSIVGYSPIVYDATIVDVDGNALLHTDGDMLGKPVPERPRFDHVLESGLWGQLRVVYGKPQVFDVLLPVERGGAPFGAIRVGISTTFMKNELRPQLNHALLFSAAAIFISLLLAAVLSNLALGPLLAIGRRLDLMNAGEYEAPPETDAPRSDEYGVVSTKIDRLGRQFRDVKEVFSALKENLDQIMATLQDGLMLFTRDWRVVLVSASAEQFVGRPRKKILGTHIEAVFSEPSPLSRVVIDAFHAHQPLTGYEIENAGGRRVLLSLDFIEERGERIGALLTMRDAESVRRIEDEIELSRRLAAIGRLTSGVAHEVKNPINAIVVHLEVLREKLQQLDPDTQRHMDVIGSEIHRLDRVVQTLVDFTRPVELRLSDIDLRQLIEEVVLLASPDAEQHGIHIEQASPAEQLPVKADADLVKQALLNIVLNGVQAMSEGGTLTITARHNNGTAEIDIQDQGHGIPEAIRDKVFNLYFTTKKKGSGIGLAMTYRIIQLHNGAVDFESHEGEGTTFHLRLPLLESRKDLLEEAAARG
jgi:signal transduction histidine kinase